MLMLTRAPAVLPPIMTSLRGRAPAGVYCLSPLVACVRRGLRASRHLGLVLLRASILLHLVHPFVEVHKLLVLDMVHRHGRGAKLRLYWLNPTQVVFSVAGLRSKVATIQRQVCGHLHLGPVYLARFVQIRHLHDAGQICMARAKQVMMVLMRVLFGQIVGLGVEVA